MVSRTTTAQPVASTTADLRVYLLGPPEVEWAGRPLVIPRRQARALLYYLAVRLQAVPRECLCLLFWPDIPECTAHRNLSHLLTHLRCALPAPEVLLTSGEHVRLDPHRTWSDTVAFERLCANPIPLSPTASPAPLAPQHWGERGAKGVRGEVLQQAVDLYRGPFLAGFSFPGSPEFEAWAVQERYAWERLYLEALAALIEEWAARGEPEAAIACARRYLETDDLAEDVHRRLIELYAAAGDRSAALRQFERCAVILERELGVSPLPETRAIYQAILKDQPPSRPAIRPVWMTLPGLDVPLVGRDGAVRRLEQAYGRAQAGHGGVVLISGEAGIGKSRLMQEFAAGVEDRALVLVGAGHPEAQTMPYQPIVQALRSAFHVPRSTFHVQPTWLAEASRLLPELRALHPELPPPLPAEPDEARSRLFEALCQIVLGLATSPLLLCLDDLHWADRATLDWLAYLGRQLRGSRLLIIGAYRSEEADVVIELRHSLARLGILAELKLAGLDAAAVLQLLRHLVSPAPGDEVLADKLQKATGGNPFFLLETLRALIEAGRLPRALANLEDLPLPDTVREAVEARLARLSPVARQVLEAGAVLGTNFGFDLVRLTAGRREMETMDGLDELVARQLLVEQAPGYRFHHDLTQRVVEMGLSPMRGQLLHRRAGRALERLEPDAVAALARHFDAGGEIKKALHYHGLAAQQAEALFAWREAERHQGRMLVMLDRLDPDRKQPDYLAQRGQVLAARAHQRFLQGRLAERDADLAALTALAEVSGDADLRLQALAHQARYLNLDGHYPEAIEAARQGLALADSLDDASARCRFLAQIGFAHYFLGQPRPALKALESALAVADSEATPETRGRITHILGYVHLHLGNYAQALTCQQEAYACHQAVGDHNRMAWDLTDIGIVYTRLNRLTEAEEHLVKALELARKIGSQPAESYALNNLGTLHYVRGDYPTALQYHEGSLVLQRATGSRRGEASALGNSGMALLALGDYAAAETRLRQSLAIFEEIGYRSGLAEEQAHLAWALASQGRPGEGLAAATRSLEVAQGIGDRHSQVIALNTLAWLYLTRAEPVAALSSAQEAVALAEEAGLTHARIFGLAILGLAHLALDAPSQAQRCTAEALALLQTGGGVGGPEEMVYLAHYRVLEALGQREEATGILHMVHTKIEAKAERISDPEQRRRYLTSWQISLEADWVAR